MTELGCQGTIGAHDEMILVGGYQAKHFIRLMKKYMESFVTCLQCKCNDTTLEKEAKSGLTYLKCEGCGANRVVQKITAGFVAKRRGQRRRERQ